MDADSISLDEQQTLRHRMRSERCALSAARRRAAADAVCEHLVTAEVFRQARSFSAYLAVNGELDLEPVIQHAWSAGKHVCLPVVTGARGTVLEFRPYTRETELAANVYGIEEPQSDASGCPASALDLVLCPLVAFDGRGTRLGMGGGYYDATFKARLSDRKAKPVLLGVAYELQRVESAIERNEWDVPLDGAVTETGICWFP